MGEYAVYTFNKGLVFRVYKEFHKSIRKMKHNFKREREEQKIFKRHFIEENIHMAPKKYFKRT